MQDSLLHQELVGAEPHVQDLWLRREVQSVIRLVAIPIANRFENTAVVVAFFDAHELALLARGGVVKVYAAEESGHEKFIVTESGDEHASGWYRVSGRLFAETKLGQSIRDFNSP